MTTLLQLGVCKIMDNIIFVNFQLAFHKVLNPSEVY